MKRTLLVLIYCFTSYLLVADISLPKHIFGYWESEELNRGIYFYNDSYKMFPLDPSKESSISSYVGMYEKFSLRADTFQISTRDTKSKFKGSQFLYFEDQFNLRLMNMKDNKKYWAEFEKRELNIDVFLNLFDLVDDFSLLEPSSAIGTLAKFEVLDEMPKEGRKVLSERHNTYGIFQYQINHGEAIHRIKKVYKFFDSYLIWTYELYAYGYGNHEQVFVIRNDAEDKSHFWLDHGSLHSSSGPLFLTSDKELLSLSKKSRSLRLQETIFSLKDLPDKFFTTFFDTKNIYTDLGLPKSIQLSRNGQVDLLGKDWTFVRIYSGNYHPLEDEPDDYIVYLELREPLTGQHKIVKIKVESDDLSIMFSHGGSRFVCEAKGKILWELLFSILLGILVILTAFFLIYRSFLLPRKLKQRLTQSQLEGIKSQLNPHFLFNSMASIQSLMNQNKIEEANKYQAELSDLLRYHLDAGSEDMVLLSEELSALQHYLELENLRKPFNFSFEIDTDINPDLVEIPNQILQPLVENAIKHGLRYAADPKLLIRVQKLPKDVCIYIIDNGPGISASHKLNEKPSTLRKTHKGLALIQEKISILKNKGMRLKLNVEDRKVDLSEEASGTIAALEIPLNY